MSASGDMVYEAPDGSAHRFTVCVGFQPDGTPGEVFCYGPKSGTVLRHVVEDSCVMASHLAQRGMGFAELRARLGNDSPMGAILDCAIRLSGADETSTPAEAGAASCEGVRGTTTTRPDAEARTAP